MIKKIILTKSQPTFCIEYPAPFNKLRMKSATSIEGAFNTDALPCIALRLRNDTQAFNLRMNLVPSSNRFDCFDVLEAASQVPPLNSVSFNLLEIAIPEHQYEGGFVVTMEAEVE